MSKKILQSRYYQLISIIAILMLALSIRLFVLTVLQEDKWAEAAVNQNTKEVVTSAPRGEILDRYGRELATNKQMYASKYLTYMPSKEVLAREIEQQKEIFRLRNNNEEEV